MSEIQLAILWLMRFIPLFPFIVSIIKYKIFTIHLRVIAWYVFLGAIIQAASTTLALQKINNLFLSHINVIREFLLLSLFFSHVLKEFVNQKKIYVLIALFTVFAVVNAIYFQPLTIYPTHTRMVGAIIIICYVLMAIYERFKESQPKKLANIWSYRLNRISFFFIFTGILLYYSGSVLLFSVSDDLLSDPKLASINTKIQTGHRVLIIIHYTFIGIGLLLFKRKKINWNE